MNKKIISKLNSISSKITLLENLLQVDSNSENQTRLKLKNNGLLSEFSKIFKNLYVKFFGSNPNPKKELNNLKNLTNTGISEDTVKTNPKNTTGKDESSNAFQLGEFLTSIKDKIMNFFKSLKPDDDKSFFGKIWQVVMKLWGKLYGFYSEGSKTISKWKPAIGGLFAGIVFLSSSILMLIYFIAGTQWDSPIGAGASLAPTWLPDIIKKPINVFLGILKGAKDILVRALNVFIETPALGILFACMLGFSYYNFTVGWYYFKHPEETPSAKKSK